MSLLFLSVFTLQSIKSRIETGGIGKIAISNYKFLLYSPLNQGLKLYTWIPLLFFVSVFTLQSIKSRIETPMDDIGVDKQLGFYSTVH